MLIRFAQKGLQRIKFLHGTEFGDVCHVLPIRRDLYEQLVLCFSRQMNCEPESVRHDDRVRKNTIATQQNIPFARHEFHWPKRLRELLQLCIEFDYPRWSVAQDVGSVACAASVALILPRELAIALWTCPPKRHSCLVPKSAVVRSRRDDKRRTLHRIVRRHFTSHDLARATALRRLQRLQQTKLGQRAATRRQPSRLVGASRGAQALPPERTVWPQSTYVHLTPLLDDNGRTACRYHQHAVALAKHLVVKVDTYNGIRSHQTGTFL